MSRIIYNIRRFIYQIFGIPKLPTFDKTKAKIDGSVLFYNEYTSTSDFIGMSKIFKNIKNPVIRVPYPIYKNEWRGFNSCLKNLTKYHFTPLVLFDCYNSHDSMIDRIKNIRNNFNDIIYFQLFNELPHMPYPGEQLQGLDDLIQKTNQYCDEIRKNIPGTKIISMPPANILFNMSFESNWKTNQEQLKRLIKETNVDIIAIHCYVNSSTCEFNFRYFLDNIKDWNIKNKPVWITETGIDGWDKHIKFYNEWTSRFYQYIPNLQKIMWYRQTINDLSLHDSGFALQEKAENIKSPLYKLLEN